MSDAFIVHARWIAPVVPAGTILEDHAIVVQNGSISEIGPAPDIRSRYPDLPLTTLNDHLLVPGFVNCHGHAAMTLLRGYADDLEMMTWLTEAIWPVEGKLVDDSFVFDGTRLAAAEMIRGGTTCAADMYFFPEAAARAFEDMKMRAQVSFPVIQFPTAWARDEEEHIHKGLAFHDEFKNASRITTAFGPHAPYSVTNAGFEKVVLYSEQLEMPMHLHLHETEKEVTDSISEHGVRPIARIAELGVISPSLQAVHMTQLRTDEIELLARGGVQVVHCPESNQKLASGFCPVESLRKQGVNVAVGTDGAASNNDLDLIAETRSASLLSKVVSGDATSLNAHASLEMMTMGGARFLGLDDDIGSLEAGKLADMTAIDFSSFRHKPMYNPVSQLINTASGQDVSHFWIGGDLLLDSGEFTQADMATIVARTTEWQERIRLL